MLVFSVFCGNLFTRTMESNRDENFSCALEEIGANTAALNILPEKSKGHDLFMKLRAEKQVCGF